MYCAKCGRIISDTKPFCRYCGARTAAPLIRENKVGYSTQNGRNAYSDRCTASTGGAPNAESNKSSAALVAIFAVAVGILAVVLVVVVLSGRMGMSAIYNNGISTSANFAPSDMQTSSAEHASSPAETTQSTTATPTITPTQYIPREEQSVEFASPEFEACIRQLLNKSYGNITVGECESVTELFIMGEYCFDKYTNYFTSGKGNDEDLGDGSFYYNGSRHQRSSLKNISDIEKFPNLVSVSICCTEVSDISPLCSLPYLKNLRLINNIYLSDISPLQSMGYLEGYLGLFRNNISDISALSVMKNVTWLGLSSNRITDITPLAGLTQLTRLNLYANQISDISALAGLVNLKDELKLNRNNISDISPLYTMTQLEILNISDNPVASISALYNMQSLRKLYMSNTNVSDIWALANLTKLKYVDLTNSPINSYQPVYNVKEVVGIRQQTSFFGW